MRENGLTKNDSMCLKGIAVMMLLFYHTFREEELFAGFSVSFAPFDKDSIVALSAMCKICVSIFAFITGYGLFLSFSHVPEDKKSIAHWSVTRLLRTMSGFYFVYIISFIITSLIDGLPFQIYCGESVGKGVIYALLDFLGLAKLFGTPKLLTTWWYMSAAIIFILVLPLLYLWSKKTGYISILIVLIMIPHILNLGYPGGQSAYTFLIPVVLGMLFADYRIFEKIVSFFNGRKVLKTLFFVVSLLFLVLYYYIYRVGNYDVQWELMMGFFPAFFIIFLRLFIIRIPGLSGVLAFFGKHSMNIFLIHNFFRKYYLNTFLYSLGHFALTVTVLFIISLAVSIILEFIKKCVRFDRLTEKATAGVIRLTDKIMA